MKRKLNVRLLRKIERHILAEPRRFFMAGLVATGEPGKKFDEFERKYNRDLSPIVPPCGTAACIAGWTGLLLGKTEDEIMNLPFDWHAKQLGLGAKFGDGVDSPLFYADSWPEPFKTRYANARTPSQRAKIAAARIEHLIKTKGEE